jgi:hypothetical protein
MGARKSPSRTARRFGHWTEAHSTVYAGLLIGSLIMQAAATLWLAHWEWWVVVLSTAGWATILWVRWGWWRTRLRERTSVRLGLPPTHSTSGSTPMMDSDALTKE